MKATPRCPRCDSTLDLPHATDAACFRALNREMAAALAQVRLLTSRKSKLMRERIRSRQRAIAGKAQDVRNAQHKLAGLLGARSRRLSGLPIRRVFRSK